MGRPRRPPPQVERPRRGAPGLRPPETGRTRGTDDRYRGSERWRRWRDWASARTGTCVTGPDDRRRTGGGRPGGSESSTVGLGGSEFPTVGSGGSESLTVGSGGSGSSTVDEGRSGFPTVGRGVEGLRGGETGRAGGGQCLPSFRRLIPTPVGVTISWSSPFWTMSPSTSLATWRSSSMTCSTVRSSVRRRVMSAMTRSPS